MFYSYNGIISFLIRNVNDFIPKMEYNISMEKFAQRLKELRKGKLTQEQLAQYLGVDQTMITKLEKVLDA